MRCRYMRVAGIFVLQVSVNWEYGCVAGMIMFATIAPTYLWIQGHSRYPSIIGIILFQI